MKPSAIVFEASPGGLPLSGVLAAGGCDICAVASTEALVDAIASGAHQAVIFVLGPDRADDMVALHLLRRLAPDFPLIVVGSDGSLEVRRLIQPFRPMYFAPRPVDPEELCEAVHDACAARKEHNGPARAAQGHHPA
jgi:DNA-binding NarL/FixJ family response regulator